MQQIMVVFPKDCDLLFDSGALFQDYVSYKDFVKYLLTLFVSATCDLRFQLENLGHKCSKMHF